jgi:ABC-type sulfate transport system permease component
MALTPFKFQSRFGNVLQSRPSGWTLAVLAIALLMLLPLGAVVVSAVTQSGEVWGHLVATVLPQYVLNSLGLMVGVGLGVLLLGVSTAWLVTMCQFPGRRVFEWALLLPLAAPSYLLAYTYTDFLDYFGWVQTTLRAIFGWQSVTDYWFPERAIARRGNHPLQPGAVSLCLYVGAGGVFRTVPLHPRSQSGLGLQPLA